MNRKRVKYLHDGGPFRSTILIERDLTPVEVGSYRMALEFTDATDYERVLFQVGRWFIPIEESAQ